MSDFYVADHSFGNFISSADLKNAGYVGDISYCSHDPNKDWKPGQIQDRLNHGIPCGLVWETTNNRSLSGGPGGRDDSIAFLRQARALGATGGVLNVALEDPVTRPQSDWPVMDAYAKEMADTLRSAPEKFRVRGYGSDRYLTHAQQVGLVDFKWAVETWPRGGWSPDLVQLYNPRRGAPTNFGGRIDCNLATGPDWGPTLFFGQQEDDMGIDPDKFETVFQAVTNTDGAPLDTNGVPLPPHWLWIYTLGTVQRIEADVQKLQGQIPASGATISDDDMDKIAQKVVDLFTKRMES